MKKYLSIIIVFAMFIVLFLISQNRYKMYSKNLFYMDTYINIKLYAKNKNEADFIFSEADKIYSKYQKLTNRYDANSDISYINNNTDNLSEITIDKDLYKMIELSLFWSEKSNHKFNINLGNIISIWKNFRDNKTGIPTKEELINAKNSINDIILLEKNKIKNNNPSIDLGGVSKGYATKKVADMLRDNNIKHFIINAGGNVVVGEAYNKDFYTIGIESPINKSEIYAKIKGNNISVVTSGGYERFYEYEGIKYHHIIDPDTLYPANNMLSVTVITEDSALADILSTTLFLLPVEDGIKLVEKLDNVEAIFYIDENNIKKTKGFNKYE